MARIRLPRAFSLLPEVFALTEETADDLGVSKSEFVNRALIFAFRALDHDEIDDEARAVLIEGREPE